MVNPLLANAWSHSRHHLRIMAAFLKNPNIASWFFSSHCSRVDIRVNAINDETSLDYLGNLNVHHELLPHHAWSLGFLNVLEVGLDSLLLGYSQNNS